jgi:hypothetical protein
VGFGCLAACRSEVTSREELYHGAPVVVSLVEASDAPHKSARPLPQTRESTLLQATQAYSSEERSMRSLHFGGAGGYLSNMNFSSRLL